MAKMTKVQFVSDIIDANPNDSRERIINKIARHKKDYRGMKFTKTMASRYYWYVTTGRADAMIQKKSESVPSTDRITITFDKNATKYQRLTYALRVLTKAGIIE